jgi:hypothetical protein
LIKRKEKAKEKSIKPKINKPIEPTSPPKIRMQEPKLIQKKENQITPSTNTY